jgi:hypothetical protein
VSKVIELASGQITATETITVELIEAAKHSSRGDHHLAIKGQRYPPIPLSVCC